METLSEFTSHGAHPRQGGGGVPPPPTRQRQLLADAENYSSSTLPTVTTINQGHHRRKGYGDEEVADDNASNYSDESRYTYQESVARRSRPASVAPNDYSQDNFSIYAATETMVSELGWIDLLCFISQHFLSQVILFRTHSYRSRTQLYGNGPNAKRSVKKKRKETKW